MATNSAYASRTPFLPSGTGSFFARRASEAGGLVLAALAGFLAVALATYASGDPSFNTATGGEVSNAVGLAGAYAADLLLQWFGLAAWALPMAFAAWAWALFRHRRLVFFAGRKLRVAGWIPVALLPVALLLGAFGAAAVGSSAWPTAAGSGGAVGGALADALPRIAGPVVGIVFAFLGVLALAGALGMPWREWRALFRAALWVGRNAGRATAVLCRALLRARARPGEPPAVEETDGASTAEPPVEEPRDSPPLTPEDEMPDAGRRGPRLSAPAPEGRRRSATRARKPRRRAGGKNQMALDLEGARHAMPPVELLAEPSGSGAKLDASAPALKRNAEMLVSVLKDFRVVGEVGQVRPGPVVTLYEFEPQPGTRTSRVIGLADDIARSMSALSVRAATIPGRSVIGIELPNGKRETVLLRELLASAGYRRSDGNLPLALGKDIGGNPVVADLSRMPHLLVAGTTGSGKSVAINSMILSLVYRLSPDECKLILIDPKMLELSVYDDIPHLLTPVVTEPAKAVVALKWTVREMEGRYQAMSRLGVRNISGYNKRLAEARAKGEQLTRRVQTGLDPETGEPVYEDCDLDLTPMPFIVVVVDEMADLMLVAGKEIEGAVQRLAQMARAAGIHLVMATQRPSVDVITGTIKANFPTRISFQVTSKIDSRTIIGEAGAEQLLGQGDMLYLGAGGRLIRVHGPFVSDAEVERVAEHLRSQGKPRYVEGLTEEPESITDALGELGGAGEDPLYDQAVALVARERKASTSFIQRHLQIGYNRAARIIERMEKQEVVSRANHAGKREVLIADHSGD